MPWPGGWHGRRRSGGLRVVGEGRLPLASVAELLGHSPAVTLKAYAHAILSNRPDGEWLARAVGALTLP